MLQTRASRFARFQEAKIQELVESTFPVEHVLNYLLLPDRSSTNGSYSPYHDGVFVQ